MKTQSKKEGTLTKQEQKKTEKVFSNTLKDCQSYFELHSHPIP